MKTIQQDLRSNNLSLDEAITVAQNRPFWRLMSAFGTTHRTPSGACHTRRRRRLKLVQYYTLQIDEFVIYKKIQHFMTPILQLC